MGGIEEGPLPRWSEAGRAGQSMTPWRSPQGRFLMAGTISPGHREGNEPTCMLPLHHPGRNSFSDTRHGKETESH